MYTLERMKKRCKGYCHECECAEQCYRTTDLSVCEMETVEHVKFNTVQGKELSLEEIKVLCMNVMCVYKSSLEEAQALFKYVVQLDLLGLIDRDDVRSIIRRYEQIKQEDGDVFYV